MTDKIILHKGDLVEHVKTGCVAQCVEDYRGGAYVAVTVPNLHQALEWALQDISLYRRRVQSHHLG